MNVELLQRYEYVVFILILQALPYFALREEIRQSTATLTSICVLQFVMICAFFVAWGGYSVDAWRYAYGFDKDPFTFKREWLFWIIGSSLSRTFYDPWPMKIISALSAGFAAGAVVTYLKRQGLLHVVIGLFVLGFLPLFIFGFGNAVRQGMAASIMLLAIIFFVRGNIRLFFALSLAALLVHVSALVLIAAALLARKPVIKPHYLLIAAPVMGILVPRALGLVDIDAAEWIPYATEHEGVFHYAKFAAAYLVAWIMLFVKIDGAENVDELRVIYVYAASFSFLLLNYEVPFERLLLLSQVVVPLVIPFYAFRYASNGSAMKAAWIVMYLGGTMVWMHGSVVKTLGFA